MTCYGKGHREWAGLAGCLGLQALLAHLRVFQPTPDMRQLTFM
jgi:hypothetical protein